MIAALVWGIAAGCLARAVLGDHKPGVLMTMIATVLGGLPLVISTGAGAEARRAIGWIIVGGLGTAAVSTLLLTPVAYLLIARFSKPKAHEAERLAAELDAAEDRGMVAAPAE